MISEDQRKIIIETLRPFNPRYIGLFGSYARNQETKDSDVDLLIDLDFPKLSLFDIGGLYHELERKLKVKIDIAFRNKLKEDYKSYVLKDLVDLYKV